MRENWFKKHWNFIGLLIWMLMWALAFEKVNHPIEDAYVSLGVISGWLWALIFVSEGMFDWGRQYKQKDAKRGKEE